MPTITLMMVMTVIWSFLVFDFVYILTQGGPAFSSEVLSTLAYRNAFYDLNVGQAAAVALVISLFGLVATFFYIRIQMREESRMRLIESRTTLVHHLSGALGRRVHGAVSDRACWCSTP